MSSDKIKIWVIIPVALALLLTLGAYVVNVYTSHDRYLNAYVTDLLYNIDDWRKNDTDAIASNIATSIEFLLQDKKILDAWESGDREAMYNISRPIYEKLNRQNAITHFYFHAPDRVCQLRVHQKERFGDLIGRKTILEAEATGKPFYGVELGPLGTFTLRYVYPVTYNEKKLGYLELGTEIDHIISNLDKVFDVNTTVLLKKKFLKRADWESGMEKVLGRKSHWDQLPNYVMTKEDASLPLNIIEQIVASREKDVVKPTKASGSSHGTHFHRERIALPMEFTIENRSFRIGLCPIYDAFNIEVGDMLVMHDVTELKTANQKTVVNTALICFVSGLALIVFFYFFLGKIEMKLSKSQRQIIDGISARQAQQSLHLHEMEIKHAELQSSQKALSESEQRYRQLVDMAVNGIALISEKEDILFINEAGAAIFGHKSADLIGRNLTQFTSPEEGERYRQLTLMRKKGVTGRYETHISHGDGSQKDLRMSVSPIFSKDGIFENMLVMFEDITDQKRAEIEKEKLEEQLHQSQKMESVGRLAGGVAHDFNNMLVVIRGRAEMALKKTDPGQSLHSDMEEIIKAAKRSADLTRQLLAFARKQTMVLKLLNLNDIVANTLNMLQQLVGEDVQLLWHPKAGLWPIKADPSQIDQILANLCVNSRDAITDIGKITIETENVVLDEAYCANHADYQPGKYVLLAMSDNGCGMDKETLSRIFEPFYTTKEIGKGTGLGLSSVYGAVKQNNGFINVYSEPGHGTTFKIYFPRHLSDADEAQSDDATIPNMRGRETILLVEDEPAILETAKMMLEDQGYTVLATPHPVEAIHIANKHSARIRLLITDVVMPEMNGHDLSRKLLQVNPNLKCLFMSGYTANVIAQHGVLEEGVQFIQKPFSQDDLAAKVREALDSK